MRYALTFAFIVCFAFMPVSFAEEKTEILKVGHVGHDHQIALFLACELGDKLKESSGGIWLRELKKFEVYELYDGDKLVAQILLKTVGGGSKMPAAIIQGSIEVGLGGVAAVVSAIDKGGQMKIIAPLNADGDMLVMKDGLGIKDWDGFIKYVKESKVPVKIGYKAPSAVAYLIFKAALKDVGISCGHKSMDESGNRVQVVMVNLNGGKNMIPSLKKGIVSGFVMNQPVVSVAVETKVGVVVADLKDLPPKGKWLCHPCCCVAVSEKAMSEKKKAVMVLLKAIRSGQKYIFSEPEKSIEMSAKWTKKPLAVEKKSIPTVTYVPEFNKDWRKGMETWFSIMLDLKQFTGKLKGKSAEELSEMVTDYSLLEKIVKDESKKSKVDSEK